MKSISKKLMVIVLLLSVISCNAQTEVCSETHVANSSVDCCQKQVSVKATNIKNEEKAVVASTQEKNPLQSLFDGYFSLKDALIKGDGSLAATNAGALLNTINAVKMSDLSSEQHTVWMKELNDLKEDVEHISETKDVGHQRDHFRTLSKSVYALMKASKHETPVYYQFCPMANQGKGAYWLSKDKAVKNPYYGSRMLSCGKTVETIK